MYKLLNISSSDFSQLSDHLSLEFDPKNVAKMLSSTASSAVAAVLIEYPYVDKDYRSTYYNFYSKKGRFYNRQCVRLHFFRTGVSLIENFQLEPSDDNVLSNYYFGFMVLRPTWSWTIGRTTLSPTFLKSFAGHVMVAQHKVHLLGRRINVSGFPWMQQHTDIAVCAHVACWSILRYYSERFSGNREYLIHDMAEMASQYDQGGCYHPVACMSARLRGYWQRVVSIRTSIPGQRRWAMLSCDTCTPTSNLVFQFLPRCMVGNMRLPSSVTVPSPIPVPKLRRMAER